MSWTRFLVLICKKDLRVLVMEHSHEHAHGHGHEHEHMPRSFEEIEVFHRFVCHFSRWRKLTSFVLQKWADLFEQPDRDDYQQFAGLLSRLPPGNPKNVALDIGSSSGFATVRLAKTFEKVYAVDTEKNAAVYLAKRCEREGITNVVTILASEHGFDLPERGDVIVCMNVLHHIADPVHYFKTVRENHAHERSVLLLVDFLVCCCFYCLFVLEWRAHFSSDALQPGLLIRNGEEFGPKQSWGVKMSSAKAIELLSAAGWKLIDQFDTPYHWNLYFSC